MAKNYQSEETRAVTRSVYLLYGGLPERAEEAMERYFTECERLPLLSVEGFLNQHPEYRPADWGQSPEERAILAQFGPEALQRHRKP